MTTQILTQERLKELLSYSPETGDFSWKSSRSGIKACGSAGCIDNMKCGKSYKRITIDYILYSAHRLAWLYVHGEFPKDQIDHIDGDGLNNRLNNLRAVGHEENQKNLRLSSRNTSGFVGVSWSEERKKWCAYICANGKSYSLGRFSDKDDAVRARITANIKHGFHKNHGAIRPL